jgi:hypothetical protein
MRNSQFPCLSTVKEEAISRPKDEGYFRHFFTFMHDRAAEARQRKEAVRSLARRQASAQGRGALGAVFSNTYSATPTEIRHKAITPVHC